MQPVTISDAEFAEVRALALRLTGIQLNGSKKALVVSRWGKRLAHHGFTSFRQYLDHLRTLGSAGELQTSIDLLTTNETYFFREPKHFEFLQREILPASTPERTLRIWSAACSSGEEPYSIAMLLSADLQHRNWEILGSDLSTRVLEAARLGRYDMERTRQIPPAYLRRFCLRGSGPQEGRLLIARPIRERVRFARVNLNEPLPELGRFDVIFLRNVLIYFDTATKTGILNRLASCLRPGGHLLIGHCDTLHGVEHPLRTVKTSIFRSDSS